MPIASPFYRWLGDMPEMQPWFYATIQEHHRHCELEYRQVALWSRALGDEAYTRQIRWDILEAERATYRLGAETFANWVWGHCHGSAYLGEYHLSDTDVLDRWFGEEEPAVRAYLRSIDAEGLLDAR